MSGKRGPCYKLEVSRDGGPWQFCGGAVSDMHANALIVNLEHEARLRGEDRRYRKIALAPAGQR